MRRLTTTLTSAAAAGLSALAVAVAATASGGGTPADKQVQHSEGNTAPLEFQASMQSHGATGVPGEEREGRGLKEWIVAHQDDESVRAALKACDVYFGDQKPGQARRADKVDCAPMPAEKSKEVPAGEATARDT